MCVKCVLLFIATEAEFCFQLVKVLDRVLQMPPIKDQVKLVCCFEGCQNGGDHYHRSVILSVLKLWKAVEIS